MEKIDREFVTSGDSDPDDVLDSSYFSEDEEMEDAEDDENEDMRWDFGYRPISEL